MKTSSDFTKQISETRKGVVETLREQIAKHGGEFIPEDHGIRLIDNQEQRIEKITADTVYADNGVDYPLNMSDNGFRVAVFDDILTTGATADALARVLLRAGAQEVEVWAIARSPAGLRSGTSGVKKGVVQHHTDKYQQAKTVVAEKSPETALRQPLADQQLLPDSDGSGPREAGVIPRTQAFQPAHCRQ